MEEKTILIADDEERILTLVSDFLKKSGYRVLIADDGEKAVEMFESNERIDLIILDIMMPGIDGWEVCRRIRKTSDVPIILPVSYTHLKKRRAKPPSDEGGGKTEGFDGGREKSKA